MGQCAKMGFTLWLFLVSILHYSSPSFLGFQTLYKVFIPLWLKKLTCTARALNTSDPLRSQPPNYQTAWWDDLSGVHLWVPVALDNQAIRKLRRKLLNLGWGLWISLNSMVMCFSILNFQVALLLEQKIPHFTKFSSLKKSKGLKE